MNDEQLLRYSRHILLAKLDIEGQQKLIDSHIVIVGLGGLGSPVALYLAAAGIGKLTFIDDDVVELSNLQRQILYDESAIGLNKVDMAKQRLSALNSEITIEVIAKRLEANAMSDLMSEVDVLIDCTDNFQTRFMLNQLTQQHKIPFVSAAAIRYEGHVTVYDPRQSNMPCYRCLYDDSGELQESCSETGVLAPMLGIIGGIQAAEAIKLVAGIGESLAGRLLIFDAFSTNWREIKLKPDAQCPVCSEQS